MKNRMPIGISLHLGLNYTNEPFHLMGAENSARQMKQIADSLHNESKMLLGGAATKRAVTQAIQVAADRLYDGDIFFLTYAGHGDWKKSNVEADGIDEGWELSGEPNTPRTKATSLFDDELYELLARFRRGVRIVIVSDSCMGGGMLLRRAPRRKFKRKFTKRRMFADIAVRRLSQKLPPASIILIAACPENRVAKDGRVYMLFTKYLLEVWDDGRFRGNYRDFVEQIQHKMQAAGESVLPELHLDGTPNPAFIEQTPFAISTFATAAA